MRTLAATLTALLAALVAAAPAGAQSDEELAKQLANPVASLISVPLQNNLDCGRGSHDDGFQYRLNLQPLVPFKVNDD